MIIIFKFTTRRSSLVSCILHVLLPVTVTVFQVASAHVTYLKCGRCAIAQAAQPARGLVSSLAKLISRFKRNLSLAIRMILRVGYFRDPHINATWRSCRSDDHLAQWLRLRLGILVHSGFAKLEGTQAKRIKGLSTSFLVSQLEVQQLRPATQIEEIGFLHKNHLPSLFSFYQKYLYINSIYCIINHIHI